MNLKEAARLVRLQDKSIDALARYFEELERHERAKERRKEDDK